MASRTAVDTASAILKQTMRGVSPHERLETALQTAHAVIREKAKHSVRCRGMGTTFVGVIIENGYLHHAGDSRVYLLRDERLMAVTHDHSLLQDFIDQGFYSREEAEEKVSRNILKLFELWAFPRVWAMQMCVTIYLPSDYVIR